MGFVGVRTPYITMMGGTTRTESTCVSDSSVPFFCAFFTVEQAVEKPNKAASASFNFRFMMMRSMVSANKYKKIISSAKKHAEKF